MKKSSLVMILALVGMVGCHSGKQVKPAITLTNSSITTSGTIEHFSSGINEPRTGLEFCEDFQRIADDWNHAHPKDGVSYGCGNIHPAETNPISPGNAAVILHETPAKKPAFKKKAKLQEMWGDPPQCVSWKWDGRCAEQPNLLPAEKAAVPVATKPIPHKKMSHDVPEKLRPIVAVEVRDGWDCHFTDYQISENEMWIKCVKSVEKAK